MTATLVGLNRIWGLGLAVDELAEIGLGLGADVPVFVRGEAAFATGVGERLTPLPLMEPWYLIVYPNTSVSTAEVFGEPDLTRDTPPLKLSRLLEGIGASHGPISPLSLLRETKNDCEGLVRRRCPQVDAALRRLHRFGPARMTGTGSAVFVPFRQRDVALAALAELPDTWWCCVARGRNRSPLQARSGVGTPGE